jgi:hypothetical protein
LALVDPSPAQPNSRGWERPSTPPEAINLDIPEEVVWTPQMIKERELAIHAIRNPQLYRELLLDLEPGRRPKEDEAFLAILHPQAYRKARPITPGQVRAEAVAAHAILNPRTPPPFAQNQD